MEKQYRRALTLEYFTVGYNILEAIASIIAGGVANSIALVGFGLDSIVESLSGLVLIWRLTKHKTISMDEEEKIEKKATIFVGMTFLILGAYVLIESVRKIISKEMPDPSIAGIIIATLSIIIMPILGYKKYSIGKELNLTSLVPTSQII